MLLVTNYITIFLSGSGSGKYSLFTQHHAVPSQTVNLMKMRRHSVISALWIVLFLFFSFLGSEPIISSLSMSIHAVCSNSIFWSFHQWLSFYVSHKSAAIVTCWSLWRHPKWTLMQKIHFTVWQCMVCTPFGFNKSLFWPTLNYSTVDAKLQYLS